MCSLKQYLIEKPKVGAWDPEIEKLITMRSYGNGNVPGNYAIKPNHLNNIINNASVFDKYALVEKKTNYYILNLDLDFKNKNEKKIKLRKETLEQSHEISIYILKKFLDILLNMTTVQNREFVYLENFYENKLGKVELRMGKHIVFPKMIVDSCLHKALVNKLTIDIKKEKGGRFKLLDEEVDNIVDDSIAKANGMRLPYFKVNKCYYAPNSKISTFKMDYDKKIDVIKSCLLRTEADCTNFDLRYDIEDFGESESKNKKKKSVKEKKENETKKIKDGINKLCEEIEEAKEIDKNYVRELIKILPSEKYLKKYDTWLKFVFICKKYGLRQECIDKSKECGNYQSKKSMREAQDAIDNIFKSNNRCNDPVTLGTLSKWCKDDNPEEYNKLRKKYNVDKNKLNFGEISLESILNYNNKLKPDYVENHHHISEEAKKVIADKIKGGCKFIFLHAPPGTGKTTTTNLCVDIHLDQILDDVFKEKVSVLSLVNRRTISTTHTKMFTSVKLHNYLNKHHFQTKYISSIEHLLYLDRNDFKVVVLDEVLSLINHGKSNTLNGRRKECLKNMITLIHNAELVIASDASINSIVSAFLEIYGLDDEGNKKYMVDPKTIFYYKNEYKTKTGVKLNIFNSDYKGKIAKIRHVVDMNMEKILNFERGIIFCDCKGITKRVKEMIDRRIEVHLRENKTYTKMIDKYRKHVVLINSEQCDDAKIGEYDMWYGDKFIVASPKIVAGVDIKTKYKEICAIYVSTSTNFGMSPFDYHQQISRTRDVDVVNVFNLDTKKLSNFFISFERNKKIIDCEMKHFKKNLRGKIGDFDSDISSSTFPLEPWRDGYSADFGVLYKGVNYVQTWYNKLFNSDKLQVLEEICKGEGYVVEHCDINEEYLKNLDKKVKADYKIMIKENKKKVEKFEKEGIEKNDNDNDNDEDIELEDEVERDLIEDLESNQSEDDDNDDNDNNNDEKKEDGKKEIIKDIVQEKKVISYKEYLDLLYMNDIVKYNKKLIKKLLFDEIDDIPQVHREYIENKIYDMKGKMVFLVKEHFDLYDSSDVHILDEVKTVHDFPKLKQIIKCDEIINIVADNDRFQCMRCDYYMSFNIDEFKEFCQNIYKKELDEIFINQKLINQIHALFKLENILGIERYCIDDLPSNLNEVKKIKDKLLENLEDIYGLYRDGYKMNKWSYKKYIEWEVNKINKINDGDDLTTYVVDCYNLITKVFVYKKTNVDKKNNHDDRLRKIIYSNIEFFI